MKLMTLMEISTWHQIIVQWSALIGLIFTSFVVFDHIRKITSPQKLIPLRYEPLMFYERY